MPKTQAKTQENQTPAPVTVVKEPMKELLGWKAPARPFKKRDREYFSTIGAIVFLLSIILLFIKEWFLIGVIIALAFLSYVLASIEPEEVEHKITSRGIFTGKKLFEWQRLGRFWVSEKWGHKLLHVEQFWGMPTQLLMLLGKISEKQIKEVLEKYLIYEEPEKTVVDKASEWLAKKVPLEGEPASTSANSKK